MKSGFCEVHGISLSMCNIFHDLKPLLTYLCVLLHPHRRTIFIYFKANGKVSMDRSYECTKW